MRLDQDHLHPNRKAQFTTRNSASTFIEKFYFWKLTTGVFEDCISIQNSFKIRKEFKKGKNCILSVMRKQRVAYLKYIILGYLNINVLWNQLYSISELVKGKVDAFLMNLAGPIFSKQWAWYVCYELIRKERNI